MRQSPKTSRARGLISLLCLHNRGLSMGGDKCGILRVQCDKIGNSLCERRGQGQGGTEFLLLVPQRVMRNGGYDTPRQPHAEVEGSRQTTYLFVTHNV